MLTFHCDSLKFFFFNNTHPPHLYSLSLHDALPICAHRPELVDNDRLAGVPDALLAEQRGALAVEPDRNRDRSEEHTSELQSRFDLVCRLLLEKKNCPC